MKRTLPKGLAQPLERDGFIKVLLDVAADRFDRVGLRVAAYQLRPATQASTEPCLLRQRSATAAQH